MITLIIPGQFPGLNDYIRAERGNRYAAATMKKQIEQKVMLLAKGLPPISRPVYMHYLWVEPNQRRDKDNIVFARKFIQDGLVRAGVLQGDGWKHIAGFSDSFAVDKHNPRVEVRIEEVEQ
jgi:Holliday junction resolvase RusA-like endonuclease